MRFRQLQSETHRQQRIRRIEAAAAAGETWVVLEQGSPPTTWPPLPSTTLEMHLVSGRALEMTIGMDETTGAARFALLEVPLDPATGERAPGEVVEEAYPDLATWRAAIETRRGQIELNH